MTRHVLSADLCARAVVAACASYGDDPIRACEARRGHLRRGVSVAALAVVQATGIGICRAERIFHLSFSTIPRSRRKANEAHSLALTAALAAIGGAQLVLAPGAPSRPRRPDPEIVSGKPEALLEPNPVPVVDLGVAVSIDVAHEPATPPAHTVAAVVRALPAVRRVAVAPPTPRRGSGGSPKVFSRFADKPHIAPPPGRDDARISDADQALIQAAIAQGKVRQVQKDDGTELVWDADAHAYARLSREELELFPEHGWRKVSGRQRRAQAAGAARRAGSTTKTIPASS